MDTRHDCVTIRSAGQEDAAGIACAHVLAWRLTYQDMLPASVIAAQTIEARTTFWRHALVRPPATHAYLVAESPDGIVGLACGGPARAEIVGHDGEVYAIYLLPAWQRRGLGRRLLCEVAARLMATGCAGAYLWVLAANAPARRFYEAMGGCEVSEKQERMGCTMITEVAYGWADLARLTAPQ